MNPILKIKDEWDDKVPQFKNKVSNVLSSQSEKPSGIQNPFLNKSGKLVNPYIDYQRILDDGKVSEKTKKLIQSATGLSPTTTIQNFSVQANNASDVVAPSTSSNGATNTETFSSGGGTYAESVGKRIANTASYNNGAAKGQCVWYARGRAVEKLGKDTGGLGHANQMWYNAKSDAKLSATAENIKPNLIVSYNKGTGSAGEKYGHVIYIEDVVGDTVYYTEGGSTYYNNGTDGVVKTASRQGIIDGINSKGSRMGSEIIGFIDLSKY